MGAACASSRVPVRPERTPPPSCQRRLPGGRSLCLAPVLRTLVSYVLPVHVHYTLQHLAVALTYALFVASREAQGRKASVYQPLPSPPPVPSADRVPAAIILFPPKEPPLTFPVVTAMATSPRPSSVSTRLAFAFVLEGVPAASGARATASRRVGRGRCPLARGCIASDEAAAAALSALPCGARRRSPIWLPRICALSLWEI